MIILVGGAGTRLGEETSVRPKPMVTIGSAPILWHIMKIYAAQGIDDFVLALGHLGEVIADYVRQLRQDEPWRVQALDTGEGTGTGGRIARAAALVESETFMVTYGDAVADIDVTALARFHEQHDRLATVTAVVPPVHYGHLELDGDVVTRFGDPPPDARGRVSGGFFVLCRGALDYIDGDEVMFEDEPLQRLAADGELMAFRHEGFWHPMDTMKERLELEQMWQRRQAPWKCW